jgi:hypothetical protein
MSYFIRLNSAVNLISSELSLVKNSVVTKPSLVPSSLESLATQADTVCLYFNVTSFFFLQQTKIKSYEHDSFCLLLRGRVCLIPKSKKVSSTMYIASKCHTAYDIRMTLCLKISVYLFISDHLFHIPILNYFKYLKTKHRLLYIKTRFVPRSKHFSSQL